MTAEYYTLYPNPTSGDVSIIQSFEEKGTARVTIVDFVGQVVYNKTVTFISGKADINITDLRTGIYFVEIRNDKGKIQNFKLVLEQ